MKILFIAPIPPPIDGQSKASKVLLDKLVEENFNINIINLSKKNLKNGRLSLNRVFHILLILIEVWRKRNNNDIIYLSLAESFLGNMRDLAIYFICRKNLSRLYIHMLGGAGMKNILSGNGLQKRLNQYFIKKIAGVIVEGPINYETFSSAISTDKIHIVPNFAEDFLFAEDAEIKSKFQHIEEINILYLSNLIPGKGYKELIDAYINLDSELKSRIKLTFVGGFESEQSKKIFLNKINPFKNVKYLGKFIDGEDKRKLYLDSHIFCLPTYYPFEGQPISILEAYATGCVVVTSNHSGIPFIFKDLKNGFLVNEKSPSSIESAIAKAYTQKNYLIYTALNNKNEAFLMYRTAHFQNKILDIFRTKIELR